MRKVISNLADSYGLHSLHREYSKKDHFKYVEEEVYELNSDFIEFYDKPILPEVYSEKDKIENSYEKGKFKFLSQVDNGISNKEAVFHYIKSIVADENINIILVHGWRAKVLNRLEKVFLNSFIDRKYNVYRYVLPFHMERSPNTSLYSGKYFVSADVSRTLKSVQQSVSDISGSMSIS
ncbi:hypothetical protein ACER0A_005130 [Haloimpatiens sp. FM7315]|uniref:hypothetical protein n=1 Tax=Haloimpatiens sp. FM7315 TaxID=3298609 RepID=UPI00370AC221